MGAMRGKGGEPSEAHGSIPFDDAFYRPVSILRIGFHESSWRSKGRFAGCDPDGEIGKAWQSRQLDIGVVAQTEDHGVEESAKNARSCRFEGGVKTLFFDALGFADGWEFDHDGAVGKVAARDDIAHGGLQCCRADIPGDIYESRL